jgi:hypothetical protein
MAGITDPGYNVVSSLLAGTPRCGVREWYCALRETFADGAARHPYHFSPSAISV